jgi:hypothetical protein
MEALDLLTPPERPTKEGHRRAWRPTRGVRERASSGHNTGGEELLILLRGPAVREEFKEGRQEKFGGMSLTGRSSASSSMGRPTGRYSSFSSMGDDLGEAVAVGVGKMLGWVRREESVEKEMRRRVLNTSGNRPVNRENR